MDWYSISFNEQTISFDVRPPNLSPWNATIRWDEISRVCYKTGEFPEPDDIYIFVRNREHSYRIPSTATNAEDLWAEILRRDLFDAEVAVQLLTTSNEIQCFPPPS